VTIQGMWVNLEHYRVYEIETQREENFLIPGTDLLEPTEMEELVIALNEKAQATFNTPPPPTMTKDEQHDLGGVLKDIRASKDYSKANSGHERFWKGSKV